MVENVFVNFIKEVCCSSHLIKEVNKSLLVLIPKVDRPKFIFNLGSFLFVRLFINALLKPLLIKSRISWVIVFLLFKLVLSQGEIFRII